MGPVIRAGFDQIFSGKGIPYWNFYQYKGLDIFSSGYYGFLNPFMYISYAISRFLFGFRIETLVIYEWLMYWLGLLCMYVLLSNLKLQHDTVWISLFAYSVPTIFFSHAYYYFTFNNFFFVPFLVWILFRTRGRRHMFVVPGIMLAFSLLM